MISLRKKSFWIAVAVAALSLPGICSAQTCGGGSSIAIAKTADLAFGTLGATGSAGTAIINPQTGARTVTGGVINLGGTYNPAGFNVLLCGPAGPKRFNVVLPSGAITLNGSGGGTMSADTFTQYPANPIGASESTPTPFAVGATLHVGANQTQGNYTGTFSVTVVRQ